MKRHAIYSEDLGTPIVFASYREATEARERMSAWDGLRIYRVFWWIEREDAANPDHRSAGVGGVFENGKGQRIVLGGAPL